MTLYDKVEPDIYLLSIQNSFIKSSGVQRFPHKAETINTLKEKDGLRQPVKISETYYMEANIGNVGKIDRIKQALTIFGFEDELLIKYVEKNIRVNAYQGFESGKAKKFKICDL